MGRLTGKKALVSGGAQGLGAAHVRAIIANGGQVVIGDIDDATGRALATELGDAAVYVHLDVTSEPDWRAAVATAVAQFGGLNIMVNNAGIASFGGLVNPSPDAWETVIAINLTGPFLGIVAAREALIASAPSAIVNISSTAGMIGCTEAHGYTASKFGLRGLTKSVALELAAFGVRCNSVHPGIIRTRIIEGLQVDVLLGPMQRVGEPSEVAQLVVYLASDESSFSTGSEFIVDGGQIAGTFVLPTLKQ
jgi:3alpha(or 20beta)-hydroxysteroid dehydrogenase